MQNHNKNFLGYPFSIFLFLFAFSISATQAGQAEPEKVCSEGSEPLAISYGDHTAECEISPATDLDQFSFEGKAGDDVRITVQSSASAGLDPRLEIRDPEGTVIADTFCTDNSGGTCSFQSNQSLTISGSYLIILSDAGLDQGGSYEINLQCLFGDCPELTPRFSLDTRQISLPFIDVPDVGTFTANLELPADSPNPNEFVLTDLTNVSENFSSPSTFSLPNNILHIPSVEIPLGNELGYFEVDMRLVPLSSPVRFEL